MLAKIKPYIISVLIALAVGGISALLTMGNMNIYSEVTTPPLSPPGFLFPIVWTILFILMGISAAIIYGKREEYPNEVRRALTVYALSLVVNFLWSIIFFNMRSFLFAFVWLLLLWFLILRTIMLYKPISPVAAYLQIPYLVWVTFAGYLNLGIFLLNM